jgi:uncharacterized protein YkwD
MMIVGAVIAFYYIIPALQLAMTTGPAGAGSSASSSALLSAVSTATTVQQTTGGRIADPSFINGSATLSYPTDYAPLVQYQLSLINQDRAKFGLPEVALSPIQSGQQHADSMAYFGYFNHWDVQGYKPYMRYTLLTGQGGMEENVAYEYTQVPYYLTTENVKSALSSLEGQMMYNDSACCQNGHRANILDPLHNRVSLGIEYDLNHVYMVQDFENHRINFSQPLVSNGDSVRFVGSLANTSLSDSQILVFYDAPPAALNKTQLESSPYAGAYNQGAFVGGVVPPCTLTCGTYSPQITVRADIWSVASGRLDIEFKITDFVQKYGNGVYTVYLEGNASTNPEILFNWSIFVNNQKSGS